MIIIQYLILLYIIISSFISYNFLNKSTIIILIIVLIKWLFNINKCYIFTIESNFFNINVKDGNLYNICNPLFNIINNKDINPYILYILLLIIIYKSYRNIK